ncbi:MAG: hypothetical protein F4219_02035 [Gammaproteobacteria bacterium]|nr:hypothetical protein [Gammaproteobacteria bacterium]
MNISEKLSRFFQGTAVVLALTFLVVGYTPSISLGGVQTPSYGMVEASTLEGFYSQLENIPANSSCFEQIQPRVKSATEPYFAVMNTLTTIKQLWNLWVCAVHDSAVCPNWKNVTCIASAITLVAAIYVGTAIYAVKALAAQAVKEAAKKAAKGVVKRLVTKIKDLILRFPTITVSIGAITVQIPWADLANLFDSGNENLIWASLKFILMNDWKKAIRICKCAIC